MLTHPQIWRAIDALASRHGMSPSGLARLAGLDPTTFNKSKRGAANGKLRWPSTESLAKVLTATGASLEDFVTLVNEGGQRAIRVRMVPLIGMAQAGNEGFWLKDVSGADAPTSRSWKSGFLKKRSASVEVVDAPDSLRLANYLGQRVAAAGSLTDRRLQVRSLHRVAGSCN